MWMWSMGINITSACMIKAHFLLLTPTPLAWADYCCGGWWTGRVLSVGSFGTVHYTYRGRMVQKLGFALHLSGNGFG